MNDQLEIIDLKDEIKRLRAAMPSYELLERVVNQLESIQYFATAHELRIAARRIRRLGCTGEASRDE